VTQITDLQFQIWEYLAQWSVGMATPSLSASLFKLSIAGEQAGFTVEQMIWLLNSGMTVAGLLWLIEWRLRCIEEEARSPRWLM
jgi:hypothetical protein